MPKVIGDTNNEELFSGNQNCSGEFILFLLDILHSTKKQKIYKLTFNSLSECKNEKDRGRQLENEQELKRDLGIF